MRGYSESRFRKGYTSVARVYMSEANGEKGIQNLSGTHRGGVSVD